MRLATRRSSHYSCRLATKRASSSLIGHGEGIDSALYSLHGNPMMLLPSMTILTAATMMIRYTLYSSYKKHLKLIDIHPFEMRYPTRPYQISQSVACASSGFATLLKRLRISQHLGGGSNHTTHTFFVGILQLDPELIWQFCRRRRRKSNQ